MIEFTNFVPGGTWENRRAEWLVLYTEDHGAVPGKAPIGMIKWDEEREDYAYFPRGGSGLCQAKLSSAQVAMIQRKLYILEVKDYG